MKTKCHVYPDPLVVIHQLNAIKTEGLPLAL